MSRTTWLAAVLAAGVLGAAGCSRTEKDPQYKGGAAPRVNLKEHEGGGAAPPAAGGLPEGGGKVRR